MLCDNGHKVSALVCLFFTFHYHLLELNFDVLYDLIPTKVVVISIIPTEEFDNIVFNFQNYINKFSSLCSN